MTLRLIEGFEAQQSGDYIISGWLVFSNGFSHSTNLGRRGTRAALLTIASYGAYKQLPGNYGTLTCGFAFNRTTAGTAGLTYQIFGFYDGTPGVSNSTSQMAVRINATTGFLSVYRGNTLLATDNLALQLNQYYYVELQVEFHGASGSYELRVAGQTRLSGTGLNTITTANAYANHVVFGGYSTANGGDGSAISTYYDDIYVCDSAGTTNNDFLGDCRVDLVVPTAEGAFSDFTPSSGVDNALLVDELTIDANYVSSITVNQKDTYAMADLPSLSDTRVFGVMPMIHAYVEEAGSRGIAPLVRSGGSNYEGSVRLLNTTASYFSDVFEKNPDGDVVWTQATVNSAEFGMILKI